MQSRLSVVYSLIMVLFVNSVHCNFGDFLFHLPLKISDSVASLFRLFEENFRYHTPAEKSNFKRSQLMSRIQNSFDDDKTTPAEEPVTAKYHNSYRKSNIHEYDLSNYVQDEEIKRDKKENKSKDISNAVADEDLVPVVPLTIPYIPQPRSGMQEYFMSRRPLDHLGGVLSGSAHTDTETDSVHLVDTTSTHFRRRARHIPTQPATQSTLHPPARNISNNISNSPKLSLDILAAIKEKRDPIAVMLQAIINQPINIPSITPMKIIKIY